MALLRRYSNNILSLLKREEINVPIGLSILLVFLLILLFAYSIAQNQLRLILLEERVKKYSHPPDSQLIQRISIIGNFAPAGNQCGFIVAQLRTTILEPTNLHAFYSPILTNQHTDGNPPYHEVSLFILKDNTNVEDMVRLYPEVYERITQSAIKNTSGYILITAETGYPPNYDIRCH